MSGSPPRLGEKGPAAEESIGKGSGIGSDRRQFYSLRSLGAWTRKVSVGELRPLLFEGPRRSAMPLESDGTSSEFKIPSEARLKTREACNQDGHRGKNNKKLSRLFGSRCLAGPFGAWGAGASQEGPQKALEMARTSRSPVGATCDGLRRSYANAPVTKGKDC